MEIKIEYIDGSTEVFPETSRPGGSYRTNYETSLGWLTITDAYGNKTTIPGDKIKSIRTSGERR